MREISLDRLRTLVAIADLGSFAEAARALHLAPPTVSLHIVELEARVGAPLLTRKRGEVRPSSIGETLVDRARRLLADADLALDDVQRQVQGLTGRVRLGASTGAIAHLLRRRWPCWRSGIPTSTCRWPCSPRRRRWRGWPPARWRSVWWHCHRRAWRG